MSVYKDNPWKPLKHQIFKDDDLANRVHELGYEIVPMLTKQDVQQLRDLYDELHQISDERGGMFYSVYSRDLEYRKQVFDKIDQILAPVYEGYFKNAKVMLHSFVVKSPGPESEFYLHQDTTGLDERKFSSINLWIPLGDVDETNGCLALVEKSHKFFSPYRSISFPAPFDSIQNTVREYLKPIRMKEGEALVFDNRLLHNSFTNLSEGTRIAVVSGVFPKEANIMTCHKETYELEGEVELIEHDDDFLMTYPKFLINCQDRPHVGKSLGFVKDDYAAITPDGFRDLCARHGVKPQGKVQAIEGNISCNLIGEPDHVVAKPQESKERKSQTVFQKVLNIFR